MRLVLALLQASELSGFPPSCGFTHDFFRVLGDEYILFKHMRHIA